MQDSNTPKCSEITKVNNFIYLGSHEHSVRLTPEFENLDTDLVINCAKEVQYPDDYEYEVKSIPLVDNDYISFLENIDESADAIDKALSEKKKIYLQCSDGISRSPAILVYYLMIHKKFTYERACNLLKRLRPVIDISPDFKDQLVAIDEC